MDKRPIRRKFKDNPYILESIEKKEIYIIKFKDNVGNLQSVKVSKEIFEVFDESERYDNARFKEYSDHILHKEINSEVIRDDYSVEDDVINRITFKELIECVNQLPEKQKHRIKKYYFEDQTLEEIAKDEKCSKAAVKYSINYGIKNILKNLKK